MIRTARFFVAASFLLLLSACGSGGGGSNPATASVHLVNAAQDSNLTVSMNGTVQFADAAAASVSDYASVAASNYTEPLPARADPWSLRRSASL